MISIIIPTLNEGKDLEVTLKSLADGLKETEYEIIISDGNSKDNTVEIAKKYTDKVLVYKDQKRQTIGMAKNDGAKIAKGDLLVFIDADVTMLNVDVFFKKVVLNFINNPDLIAQGSRIRVLPELETISDKFFRTFYNEYNIFINNILHLGTGAGEFQVVKTKVFNQIKGFNEQIAAGEDHDLFVRLSKIGQVRFDRGLLVYERGRRAHAVGWPKLMFIWMLNGLSVSILKKSFSKEWKEIR